MIPRSPRHFGVICSPVPGHINPLCTLARELIRRGHRVTVLNIPDVEKDVIRESVEFAVIGESLFPVNSWAGWWEVMSRKSGPAALLGTLKAHAQLAEMMCREVPAVASRLAIDALLVDQLQFHGAALAAYMKVPFITLTCPLPLNRDKSSRFPPSFVSWKYGGESLFHTLRNRLGFTLQEILARPTLRAGNRLCAEGAFPPFRNVEMTYSSLAQICNMPRSFEFPRNEIAAYHYTGPYIDEGRAFVEFPFEKLNGKPLVYATMGTLYNRKDEIHSIIARACAHVECQLVLSMGHWKDDRPLPSFPGNPVVVKFAPTLEVLKRASVLITHAGLNTVLESLALGVPMVAIPITDDQPGVAARVAWTKTGRVIPFKKVSVELLERELLEVLSNAEYRNNCQSMRREIQALGGVNTAADIIESVI